MWKFCGKAQFPHYAETLPIHKVSVPGTKVKLPYFTQSRQSLSLIGNIYAVTKYLDCKYPKKFWLFFFHFLHLFYLSGFNFAERCICLFRQRKKKIEASALYMQTFILKINLYLLFLWCCEIKKHIRTLGERLCHSLTGLVIIIIIYLFKADDIVKILHHRKFT